MADNSRRQYHVNLARQLIHTGRIAEARAEIATLRSMGRLGQNEAAAVALEQRIPSSSTTQSAP